MNLKSQSSNESSFCSRNAEILKSSKILKIGIGLFFFSFLTDLFFSFDEAFIPNMPKSFSEDFAETFLAASIYLASFTAQK